MKKVLEVIRQGQIGGGESHLFDLVYYLDQQRYVPICLSFTDGEMVDKLRARGVECHVIPTGKAFDPHVWRRIVELIKEKDISMVHAHGSRAASNVLYAARKCRVPLVYTVHGWSFHDDQPRVVQLLRGWSEKLICSQAARVICVSESNAETGRKVFGLKAATVIENGINLDLFNPERSMADLRPAFGFAATDFVVGFIARMTKQKNPLLFLKALQLAHEQNPSIKGLLVGQGDMDDEVDGLIAAAHMEDYVFRSPFRTDVPELLHSIDAYCLPSLWEGLSIALLEAMAMGKAIIATPTDGTKELITDGDNGLTVAFDNAAETARAMLALSNDAPLAARLGHSAMQLVRERFDARRVAAAVMEVYECL